VNDLEFGIEIYKLRPFLLKLARTWGPRGWYASAEDLVQDTFMLAWQNRDKFVGDTTDLKAWMATVLRNHCFSQSRRASNPRLQFAEFSDEVNDRPSLAVNPEEALNSVQELEQTIVCMASLTRAHQDAVVAIVTKYSYIAAAEVIGCPEGTFKTRLLRARKQLGVRV
jgi:RNA polymerase sigma-70 factor, ECF subfamily